MTVNERAGASPREDDLAEVWGDIVSRRDLGRSLVIGAVVSLLAYWIGLKIFVHLASSVAEGRALAMLLGMVGCVVAGVICAVIFRPKRIVTEEIVDGPDCWRHEIIDHIEAETGAISAVEGLSPAVLREMQEVGVLDLFRDHAQRSAGQGGH